MICSASNNSFHQDCETAGLENKPYATPLSLLQFYLEENNWKQQSYLKIIRVISWLFWFSIAFALPWDASGKGKDWEKETQSCFTNTVLCLQLTTCPLLLCWPVDLSVLGSLQGIVCLAILGLYLRAEPQLMLIGAINGAAHNSDREVCIRKHSSLVLVSGLFANPGVCYSRAFSLWFWCHCWMQTWYMSVKKACMWTRGNTRVK